MTFEYSPSIWPFLVSLGLSAGLGLYALRKQTLAAAGTFAWLMAALTVWTACYVLELSSPGAEAKLFWASAKYLGSASAPVLWFVLALRLTNRGHWLTPGVRAALWIYALGTMGAVWTNGLHGQFWTEFVVVPELPENQAVQGPLFWVYGVGCYGLVVASSALFFERYWHAPFFYKRQAVFLALGGIWPLAGRTLHDFFGIDLLPHVDPVILLLLMSGICFALAIFRYGALDIVHVAHELVVQNIGAGIVVIDLHERVVELNPYMKRLLEPGLGQPVGRALREVLPGWPDLTIGPNENEIAVGSGPECSWYQVHRSAIGLETGAPAGQVFVLLDVTARKRAEQELEALARTDALTGIPNRRSFGEMAAAECARARRHKRGVALILFDVDRFKAVNDEYGHPAGDAVLREIARRCQRGVRATDLLARIGGEEFAYLLADSNLEDALITAERLRELIVGAPFEVGPDALPLRVSVSIGVSHARGEAADLEELIARADGALYAAKSSGRNRVAAADPATAVPGPSS